MRQLGLKVNEFYNCKVILVSQRIQE